MGNIQRQDVQRAGAIQADNRWAKVSAALLFVLVIGTGAVFRGLTFDRKYPVIGSGDEAKISLHAMDLRPDMPMKEAFGATVIEDGYAYPPLALWVYIQAQRITEARVQFPFPTDYVYANRATAAAFGILTTALMCWLGWAAARPLGRESALISALAVGGIWSIDGQLVPVNNIAATDPIYYPFLAISLATTILAIRSRQPVHTVIALLGAIGAVYTKYIPVYGLWLPAVAVLVQIRSLGLRRMLPWLILMALLSALSAFWLIGIYDALNASVNEAERAGSGQIFQMFSPARNWHNLKALGQFALDWWWTLPIMAAGAAAGVWSRRHGRPVLHPAWLLVVLPFGALCIMLYSSIELYNDWWRARYILPAAMVVMLLTGVSLAQIRVWLSARVSAKVIPLFWVCLVLLVLPAEIQTNLQLVEDSRRIDTRQTVWQYADSTIEPEGKIMMPPSGPTEDLWNRSWSGYNGATPFEWVFEAEPARQSPQAFVNLGVAYLVATQTQLMGGRYGEPEALEWINQLYPLKTVHHVPGNDWSYDLHVFRLLPPQVDANVTFGEIIHLDGYDISRTRLSAGDTLYLRPFWKALQKPVVNYNIFAHLYADRNLTEIIAQYDGSPAKTSRPATTWDDPDEVIPGSAVSLTIPSDIPTGDYTLALGLYDYNSGARLTTDSGEDRLSIPLRIDE